ncbi:hypothetical protein J14TS2_03600 [Bacillus sp. J14TS2]|nr:hypothetical protein J14TS2_03600 [Bacillus sp. J14TS2]
MLVLAGQVHYLAPYLNRQGQDLQHHPGEVILLGYIPFEEGKGQIAGPGHNAVFTDDGGIDWVIYHGITRF